MTKSREFEISWTDGNGYEIRDTVFAFDAESAVRSYRRIRPETEGVSLKCRPAGEKRKKRRA